MVLNKIPHLEVFFSKIKGNDKKIKLISWKQLD